jgi:Cu2+-exporting ATPase
MEQYTITGMSCAACSARVEKAVSSLEGVTQCSVNLLTNSMTVEGTADKNDIIKAVKNAGYGIKQKQKADESDDNDVITTDTKALKIRFISSLIFMLILMYVSMGHTMWGFPMPEFFVHNHIAMGLLELLLSGIIMVINQRFFISGFKGLIHKAPNMDTLVSLGAGASFIYSTYQLFEMTVSNNQMDIFHNLYFESAGMILTLITLGKMLEAYSKGKTTDALKSLMALSPKNANIIENGTEKTVPIDKVKIKDIIVVKSGESIPVDGIIIEGTSAVDESALTGESIPVDKEIGDKVSAATINQSGYIKCEATKVGEDTTLSQIIKMVKDASATKAPIAKIADKVSGIFVPAVLLIALITMFVWLIAGNGIGFALTRGISVLVISCPCALGLATPVAIMVGNGVGAKNGILFKSATSLEEAGKIQTIALDKTGTITKGEPKVTNIIPFEGTSQSELLKIAYSLEIKSEHPLAKAIVSECIDKHIKSYEIQDFQTLSGNGLMGKLNNSYVFGGNYKFISSKVNISDDALNISKKMSNQWNTPLFFSTNEKLLGIITVADVIKDDSTAAIKELHNMGIKVIMLTGDNKLTANAIGKQVGVDEVVSDVLPEGKDRIIQELQKTGKVAMVGDGINDAPALTRADIGIAIGAGTDIAIDAGDVVLMKNRLRDVPAAIRLSRDTLKNIRENLFWAFFYNIIGIPLAAGIWIPIFGWTLSPMFGAAAMGLSSFCVVTNALRLNLLNINSSKKDKKIKRKRKETKAMEKTLKIEGMMCPHCEATVKTTLEAIPQVTQAVVSHTNGTAIVTLNGDIDDTILKEAVENKGYKVL